MITSDMIERLSARISSDPFGYAVHRPEPWAEVRLCFHNVMQKVQRDKGRPIWGWYFQHKISLDAGEYLIAVHHAVWASPSGHLYDVTPFHLDPMHHPLNESGNILFRVDLKADPIQQQGLIAPLPSHFLPIGDKKKTKDYCKLLAEKEKAAVQALYDEAERIANP